MNPRTLSQTPGWKKGVREALTRFPGLKGRGIKLAAEMSVPTLTKPLTAIAIAKFACANLFAFHSEQELTAREREAMRAVELAGIAENALQRANRPAGSEPRHVAVKLGFQLLPRCPRTLDYAYLPKVIAYRFDRNRVVRDRRVALGLACGVLTEHREPFTSDDVLDLACLLAPHLAKSLRSSAAVRRST
jgi:hypothetical protein